MNIYFGKVSKESQEEFGTEGLFPFEGELFGFVLNLNEEQISIHDSVGRYVPIALEDLQGLLNTVTVSKYYADRAVAAVEFLDSLNDKVLSV